MNEAKPYGPKVAERIFRLIAIGSDLDLREDGVYLSDGFAEAAASVPALLWAPQCALLDGDPQDSPLLPIPFSGKDLAAFLLCPITRARSLDELKEHLSGVRDGLTRRAVAEADVELTRAEQKVGPFDDTLRIDADQIAGDYQQRRNLNRALLGILDVTNNGLSNDEYSRRIGEANDDVVTFKEASWTARQRAEAHEIEWLNLMVRALYQRTANTEEGDVPYTRLPLTPADDAPGFADATDLSFRFDESPILWQLGEMRRSDELRSAIYGLLKKADKTVPPPTARHVVAAWAKELPEGSGIVRVHQHGVDYVAANTDGEKSADISKIQERIDGLIHRL